MENTCKPLTHEELKAMIKEALFRIVPALATELMRLQEEMRKEEDLLTFRQVAKEYKLNYNILMKLKAKGVLIYTMVVVDL
ncbi:hypothetical protein QNI16_07825 [Cytophagaceae bacterium YF14B1]|uniref:Uncharacterized protein n=1 Tax=Xanthocytophaga flava TaxID=3048013 RepID=A0AAE3QN46_9BACT|nr:hypothetical protein [Xanthocytophaga flavus]MDJ1480388.1 hypothetical protein [Xanthocytophaga flavus]